MPQRIPEHQLDELLGPSELAELCRVPLKTVYAWNYNRTGPPFLHLGRHVRYRRQDVARWLEGQIQADRPVA